MTPTEQTPQTAATIASATSELRRQTDDRWVEVADDVLRNVLLARRRSMPVRAESPSGTLYVGEPVIVAYLRHRIDERLPGAAVSRVILSVSRDSVLETVTIQMLAQYDHTLMELADHVREIAQAVLLELLGGGTFEVRIVALDVHFSDVTVGNPHLFDPGDE